MRLAWLSLPAALLLAAAAPAAEPHACQAALSGDPAACDTAIAAERDPQAKAELLFGRAYVLVEKYRFEEAVQSLDEAIRLAPDFAEAYHERAYALGELREFERALRDSDRDVALRPDYAPAYEERAYLRQRGGDLEGAFRDRGRIVELKPGDAGSLLARGAAALWTGRFDLASADTAEALRLASAAGDEKLASDAQAQQRAVALWRDRPAGGSPEARCRAAMNESELGRAGLIGDCTAAFLAAATPFDKADLLTIRSIAWLVGHQDEPASIADQEVAVGLDPGNHQWRANLGGSYRRVRHSWAGKRELDRSLAIQVTWVALAERAAAHYNLGDREAALADAKKSFEMKPNEIALIVLGDLSKDRDDEASARRYWMDAYHLGSRDDGTIERLKSIGIDHPEQEPKPK